MKNSFYVFVSTDLVLDLKCAVSVTPVYGQVSTKFTVSAAFRFRVGTAQTDRRTVYNASCNLLSRAGRITGRTQARMTPEEDRQRRYVTMKNHSRSNFPKRRQHGHCDPTNRVNHRAIEFDTSNGRRGDGFARSRLRGTQKAKTRGSFFICLHCS